MTKGLGFLLVMLIEGVVAALLGAWLHRRFGQSRFGAGLRAGAAAVIGTGATHPLQWMAFPVLLVDVGVQWQAIALVEIGAVLVETLFYAAVLRGHWRWSMTLSIVVNAVGFSAALAAAGWIVPAATGS